jgi:hypothetical protein
MSDGAYNKIVDALMQVNKPGINDAVSNVVYGTIVTLNPLSISISNMVEPLPANFFILGLSFKTRRYKMVPHTHDIYISGWGTYTTSPSVETYIDLEPIDPLVIGDKVLLFSFNKGQKYYVAEKAV